MRPHIARPMAMAGVPLLLAGTAACAAATAVPDSRAGCPGPAASLRLDGAVYGVASAGGGGAWAVGWAGARDKELIARWDGTAWRRVPVPGLGGSSAGLDGVAAASARSAWAVGYENGSNPLILHWDGRAWRQVPPPAIPGGGALNAVSAHSPGDIWAVGETGQVTQKPSTLILHWDGRGWSRLSEQAGFLDAVAATSSRSAWAVGISAPDRTSALHCTTQG